MSGKKMNRHQLMAADVFGYSYDHYFDRIGIGKIRFDKLMPNDIKLLERAIAEKWKLERVARELEIDTDAAASLLEATRNAMAIADAPTPTEAFRTSLRNLVQRVSEKGLDSDESIENLVLQICYRVADFSHLLTREGQTLEQCSGELRRKK